MTRETEIGESVMLERRLRAYELALETARRDSVQAAETLAKLSARIEELELELARARERPAELEERLAEQQRARRLAEQRAHAERSHREQLEVELSVLERERDRARDARIAGVLTELRAELNTLRGLVERESAARARAERRVRELERELSARDGAGAPGGVALDNLRAELASLTGPFRAAAIPRPSAPAEAADTPTIAPDRFEAALRRLRTVREEERAVPEPVMPIEGTLPWIGAALRGIGEPEAVGRLMLGLLVAQRSVHPDPIAYDIELAGMPCLQLTVAQDGQRLESAAERRPADAVRFAITGSSAGFGKLIVAGRLKRRLGRGLAKVHGDRAGLRALDAILGARLTIAQLRALGLRIEPVLGLQLAAAMIEPGWTRGSSFALAYSAPAADAGELPALVVADGLRVTVSRVATPDTVLACEPDDLLALLAGASVTNRVISGDPEPLHHVQSWLERAQSGSPVHALAATTWRTSSD